MKKFEKKYGYIPSYTEDLYEVRGGQVILKFVYEKLSKNFKTAGKK